jgi:rubrerythrin
VFETNRDVLEWYEKQPRALTKEFMEKIPWHKVKQHALNSRFIPVLKYMRDVESLTEIYQAHLMRTPTGKNPVISKFMERWGAEELTHGELLNRFLAEAGVETSDDWIHDAKREIPRGYKISSYLTTLLTNCVGKSFTAAHMTYGAINEISTLQGYRRLVTLAEHPVLTEILRAIMREESVHAQFYWSVARLELERSEFSQKLSRFVVKKFWVPVGQGAKPEKDANYTIATLFGGREGFETVKNQICGRVQNLPGFAGLDTVSRRLSDVCLSPAETA